MSKEEDNKAVVMRWFTEFCGKDVNLAVVDEIAAPDMLLKYSLHEPRRGRNDIKAFMTDFRAAFPDQNFRGTADLIAEDDYGSLSGYARGADETAVSVATVLNSDLFFSSLHQD